MSLASRRHWPSRGPEPWYRISSNNDEEGQDLLARARREKDVSRELAAVARALGHPARMRIVRLLIKKQACIGCDLVDEIGLAQSTTSEHLRILKAAGVITGEIEHPRVCYSLNAAALRPLRQFLATAEACARSRPSGRA